MSTAIAKNLMAEMKLLGMMSAFDQTVSEATRDQTSYTEFLDTLLQAESDYRQERKTGYRIKAARFTLRPSFEDFDFTASRSISKAQIKEIYSLNWLKEGRPLLLIGQTGVGKTFIAQAVGLHACASGYSVLYTTVTTWLENLALARSSGTYLRYRDQLSFFERRSERNDVSIAAHALVFGPIVFSEAGLARPIVAAIGDVGRIAG